ncbi:MAG: nicotinate-nucleotide diphosphorylase (carboxylating) [Piscirickettsiaceae bacterium]|nr:MAG: nicotinate-nucleotide diphosphorylase (carboxylating) [Piscirickettsiaceae bacterium]
MMNQPLVKEEALRFLAEDVGSGDLTANVLPETKQAKATLMTRESAVICGQAWVEAILYSLDPSMKIMWHKQEGEAAASGDVICTLSGSARAILTGERAALNVLQTLSATATVAAQYAKAVEGTGAVVLDTRKTLPGLRLAQKYAVRCGGCTNHRVGLYDGILIKENHIIAAGSIDLAVKAARLVNTDVPVEVEVETLDEVTQALEANADILLLDNFTLQQLKQAVERNQGRAKLEASGNVSLGSVRKIANTGVDYVSVGALTKHINAIDLSLRVDIG